MLSALETTAMVSLIVGGSVAFLWLLRVFWPAEQRRPHNDLIGWQISVLGTSYAVIIGFMLYAVWTNFEVADGNAEAEANSLVNLVRSARGLPSAQSQKVLNLGRQYVDIMLTQEWPAMNRLTFAPASHQVIEQLWLTLIKTPIHNSMEQTSLDHAMSELTKMTEHRRLRQLQARSNLPDILWTVLVVGAILTILSACLFDISSFKLHLIQVFMLSFLLALVLVAIADINRPFQGAVHVLASGFENARDTLAAIASNPQ